MFVQILCLGLPGIVQVCQALLHRGGYTSEDGERDEWCTEAAGSHGDPTPGEAHGRKEVSLDQVW